MSQERKKILELQSRHLAKQGAESVDHLEAVITRARVLLETGEVVPQPDEQSPFVLKPYRWELSEPRRGEPKRLWLGTIEKLATGQGHTVYFLAGLAYDEDEFRRSISRELGPHLANSAKIGEDVDRVPFGRMLLPKKLEAVISRCERGEAPPAMMTYLARYHSNYS